MALQIFPYILARYASLPFSILAQWQLPGVNEHLTAMEQLRTSLQNQREALVEQLFTAIKEQSDNKERQRLLQIKRDIFNGKWPPASALATHQTLSAALQLCLDTYTQQQSLARQWEHAFNEQLAAHRRHLQSLSRHELLRKGILLSSPVLYAQLDSFAAANPRAFRNRELKNEYSLLRYLTRMACKTSPFSTFTYTGIATADDGPAVFQQPAVHSDISSGIRLNNGLFAYIRSLMIHHPLLNEILELRLNVTASIREEQLFFLINYFNVEAFQRLPARNLPLWLYNFMREQPAPVTTGELLNILSQQIPDAGRESIKDFVLKLAASGFLEAGMGCSGVDPDWDTALGAFLEPHKDTQPAAASLHKLLSYLAGQKEAYTAANSHQRHTLLEETANALNHCLQALQEEAGLPLNDTPAPPADPAAPASFEVNRFAPRYFTPQDLFYEDAVTQERGLLPAAGLADFTHLADRLCSLLEQEDPLMEERRRMCNFFLQHYGPHHREDITAFYHAYYLHEKKAALANKQSQSAQPQKPLNIPPAMELSITAGQVSIHAPERLPYTQGAARGMFVQFFNGMQDGKPVLHGVINASLPGLGKVAGRFLHLLPPAVTDRFVAWNTALHPDQLLMELNDGSSFNANIHPPLLPYEIGMPGGHNNYPPQRWIALKDVQVRYDPQKQLLVLVHAPGAKEIYAYDLCLESFYNRSHFYRLLAHFNPQHWLPLRRFIAAVDEKYAAGIPASAELQLKPAIVFEDRVVLRRKGWLLATAAIPAQHQGETDAAYFIRLHTWRLQQQLPEHVFLFLRSPYIPSSGSDTAKLQRDDYKPQYICFTQPLLVALFKKLLSRAGNHCYLEEMLPHAAHLQQQGASATVAEYMLHWYKY
jgi:hypothetical protein